jgi:GntR family transcriptional regulator
MANKPAYKIIYASIKKKIKEGDYATGALLPTEQELEEQYSVSRTTVRKAIGLLTNEGYLRAKQGRGTEVLDVSTTQKPNHITSVTETLIAKGYNVTTQAMLIERISPPDFVAHALCLGDGTKVHRVQRVQCADSTPIAIMVNYIVESIAPDLEKYADKFISLYQVLENQYGVIFKDSEEHLSAVSADFSESQILKVPPGAPLLCNRRICTTEQGPFEYSVSKFVADKYEFSVYLQGRG